MSQVEAAAHVQGVRSPHDSFSYTVGVDDVTGILVVDYGLRFVVTLVKGNGIEVRVAENGPFRSVAWSPAPTPADS